MNKLSLILRALAVIAGFVAVIAWFTTRGILDEKQVQLNLLNEKLASSESMIAEAEDRIASLAATLEVSGNELSAARESITDFQDRALSSTRKISSLEGKISELEEARFHLQSENERLKEEITTVRSAPPVTDDHSETIRGYKLKIADMEREISDLQSRLSRDTPVAVNRSSSHPEVSAEGGTVRREDPMPIIRARVAAYRTDQRLLVLERNPALDIRKNEKFHILKNDGTVSGIFHVTVISGSGIAGVMISSTEGGEPFKVGDSVQLIQ